MQFFLKLFQRYDVSSEIMMLVMNTILLLVIYAIRPKRTRMFKLAHVTSVFSFFTILCHLAVISLTCFPEIFSKNLFYFFYSLYVINYITVLNELYAYLNLLSYKERASIRKLCINITVMSTINIVVAFVPMIIGKILYFSPDGNIFITKWQFSIEICGLICTFFCFISTLVNRRDVSRIVLLGSFMIIPVDAFILIIQWYFETAYFTSFTYVIPIFIIVMLFHSFRFDDIIGCQNIDAMESVVQKAIKRKQNYVIINIIFPQLRNREFSDMSSLIEDASSSMCRRIERMNKKIRIYSSTIYDYSLFCEIDNFSEGEQISEGIRQIFSAAFKFKGRTFSPTTKELVIMNNSYIDDFTKLRSFVGFMRQNFNDDFESEYVLATRWDIDKFKVNYMVEQTVIDIRAKGNIDDDRIECFIQPIHCIKTNSFRTGEALMRMKIGDKMISPEIAVSVAEANNCIHAITKIMLNKVCKKIHELEKSGYDFDAITVNCSTLELADINFNNEVMEIIEANEIKTSHLRIEITESTTITNYRNILNNMLLLNGYGINFYLDDFGTGYSNLERISRYPFKTIKFDKSILYSALSNKNSEMLMRTLVWYFSKNGIQTVVEGVEDEKQYAYCKAVGFEYIQGYLFSKPVPIEKIIEFFKKN